MLEFPDKPVDLDQLSYEIQVLNLPNFTTVQRLSRRPNTEGKWVASIPYITVQCGKLTATQMQQLEQVITNHVKSEEQADTIIPEARS